MSLPFDVARCNQHLCPVRDYCQRWCQRNMAGPRTPFMWPDYTDNGCQDLILTDRGQALKDAQLDALRAEMVREVQRATGVPTYACPR